MHDDSQGKITPGSLNITRFSELIRTMSVDRFHRFVDLLLKTDDDWSITAKSFSSHGRFLRLKNRQMSWGYYLEWDEAYIIAHHVPSFIEHIDMFDIYRCDLVSAAADKDILSAAKEIWKYYGSANFSGGVWYISNKIYTDEFRKNKNGFLSRVKDIEESTGLRAAIQDPIQLAEIAQKNPDLFAKLCDILCHMDGYGISLSPSGISVLPFLTCDAYRMSNPSTQVLVCHTSLCGIASPVVEALYDLQEIVEHSPKEERIDAFFRDHPNLLLEPDYRDLRTQIVLGPNGDRPDFFLETHSGVWEVLEIKRPIKASRLFTGGDTQVVLRQYLAAALEQCKRYLDLLDKDEIRKRLWDREGIRYDEPRIVLLVGRQQYPHQVLRAIRESYDSRICLQSYEDLMKRAIAQKTVLLQELAAIPRRED